MGNSVLRLHADSEVSTLVYIVQNYNKKNYTDIVYQTIKTQQ